MTRKIIWTTILLLNFSLLAKSPACKEFEIKSDALIKEQDHDIDRLKGDLEDCEDKLSSVKPSLPYYVWVGVGILVGGAATLYLSRR